MSHRIEFQMQDVGAFGYNQQVIEIKPMLFIDLTQEVDTSQIDKNKWQRVDEYVNELELKGG